jgi:predicted nuclease of predicted toxin-antitoxin system
MRFKIDENLPYEVAEVLVRAGHDATTVLEQGLAGERDATVASVCQREKRAPVTLDIDFADIRTYPPDRYPGLIVLRLQRQDKLYVLGVFTRVMEMLAREKLEQHLWIVEDARVRIRS